MSAQDPGIGSGLSSRYSMPIPCLSESKINGPFSRLVGDVWTRTAEHLDLVNIENFAQVSRSFFESWTRTDKIPILVREAVRALNESLNIVSINKTHQVFELFPECRRLIAKKGSREVIMKNKNLALKNVLQIAAAELLSFPQIRLLAEQLFDISYSVGNLEAMQILLVFKTPDLRTISTQYVLSKSTLNKVLTLAAVNGQIDVLRLLINGDNNIRVSLSGLNDALRKASTEGDIRACGYLLATIARREPRDAEVNTYISKAMNDCAENGHLALCIELITQLQLRVRLRQIRLVEWRQQQQNFHSVGDKQIHEEIVQQLQGEEAEVFNGLRLFRMALKNILQIACRGQQLGLIQKVLECNVCNEINEETFEEVLKTAVRNGNEEVARLLVDNRHVNKRAIAELFVDAARRGHSHSIRALLETGCIQKGTIQAAKSEATRRGHSGVLANLEDY